MYWEMNTDQAIKYTSVTVRCQPYVWHVSRSSHAHMKNMQVFKTRRDYADPKLIKTCKYL